MGEIIVGLAVLFAIVYAIAKFAAGGAGERVNNLESRVRYLEGEIGELKRSLDDLRRERLDRPELRTPAPSPPPRPDLRDFAPPPAAERALPEDVPRPRWEPAANRRPQEPVGIAARRPDPPSTARSAPLRAPSPESFLSGVDWESFMGVKLFAWLGGFALFLGAAFFVKYSIEHELISPLMRVAIGFVLGIGVIVGGLLLRPRGYAVTVQALCAAGVAVLYADIFAARSFYHFIGTLPAFGLMSLVTAAAFLLALRLDAQYVSVLGLIGGFLTPYLLSTGENNPVGLFGYILLLDIGLLAVVLKTRWSFLVPLSVLGTLAMEAGWTGKFFTADQVGTAMVVWLLFAFLYLAAAKAAGRIGARDPVLDLGAVAPALAAIGFSGYLLTVGGLGAQPGYVLGLASLALAGVSALVLFEPGFERAHAAASAAAFLVLLAWFSRHLTEALLPWGLAFILVFAVLTAVVPIVLLRLRPSAPPLRGAAAIPALAVLLFVVPVAREITGFVLWPALTLAAAVALAAAWILGEAAVAVAVVIAVFLPMGAWIGTAHGDRDLPGLLGVVAFFSVALFAAGLLRLRRTGTPPPPAPDCGRPLDAPEGLLSFVELPSLAALLPFLLIIAAALALRPTDPSPLFGIALLVTVLLLALVRLRCADLPGLAALLATAVLCAAWNASGLRRDAPWLPFAWYLGFIALHLVFPFVFSGALRERTVPWMTAALAGPLLFFPVYQAAVAAFGKQLIGLLPAALALPYLGGLLFIIRRLPAGGEARLTQSAWFGGVALFFVTLVFPLQFSNEWLSVAWALEGAALVWLFRRVPHPGLLWWGAGLLAISFVRLALNPAVMSYHPRAATPLLNWYLWAYGLAALAHFTAAHLLPREEFRVQGISLRPMLRTLGTVLAFLLVNIEIADYFSTGTALTFRFSGSFALDLTYSLAWGAFALVLLVAGIRSGSRGVRLASLGLFGATILKVFLHDLWRLGQLYRVGSIVVLAVLLILVSFLYQRFLGPATARPPAPAKQSTGDDADEDAGEEG